VQEHSRGGAAGGAGGQWRGLVVSAATHWAFPPLPRDLTPPKHSFNQVRVRTTETERPAEEPGARP